jgi:hypothetical protein
MNAKAIKFIRKGIREMNLTEETMYIHSHGLNNGTRYLRPDTERFMAQRTKRGQTKRDYALIEGQRA